MLSVLHAIKAKVTDCLGLATPEYSSIGTYEQLRFTTAFSVAKVLLIFVEVYFSISTSTKALIAARFLRTRPSKLYSAPVASASSIAVMGASFSIRSLKIPKSIAIRITAVFIG